MSVSSGWGRFSWGQANWNADVTLKTGWGAKSWGEDEWGQLSDAVAQPSGLSIMFLIWKEHKIGLLTIHLTDYKVG